MVGSVTSEGVQSAFLTGFHYRILYAVISRIKAGLIPVEDDVRARLLFTSGFYSNQVFLCMSTSCCW